MSYSASNQLEELKRTSRILELVQIIAVAPRRYLRRDLAHRFEISERMIQKDLDIIRHGLKLSLCHSPEGYYFEDFPHLPSLQYSFSEALALFLALQAARQVSGIGSAELAAAIARLEALFPYEFVPMLRHLVSQPTTTARQEHRQEMLNLLNQALIFNRKIHIIYETRSRSGEISERVIHPFHLMPYVRSWQLIAFCEKRQKTLVFKVDRIHQATLMEEKYKIPEQFNLDEYLQHSWGVVRDEEGKPEEVILRFDALAGHWVAEEQWHPSQIVEETLDGSIIFRLQITITPEFTHWLLYYGDRVWVEQPIWLREKVKEAHRRAVEIYEQNR